MFGLTAGAGADPVRLYDLLCCQTDPLAHLVTWSVFAQRPFIAVAPFSSIRVTTDAIFAQKDMAVEQLYESGPACIVFKA